MEFDDQVKKKMDGKQGISHFTWQFGRHCGSPHVYAPFQAGPLPREVGLNSNIRHYPIRVAERCPFSNPSDGRRS